MKAIKYFTFLFLLVQLAAKAGTDLNLKICNQGNKHSSFIVFDGDQNALSIKSYDEKSSLIKEYQYEHVFSQMPVAESNFLNLQMLLKLAEIKGFSDGLLIQPLQALFPQFVLLRFAESDYSVILVSQEEGTQFLGKTSDCVSR